VLLIKLYKQNLLIIGYVFFAFTLYGQQKTIQQKVDSVIHLMTLEEKIGQLNQYSGEWAHTGPITADGDIQNQIKRGQVGSMLNVIGVDHTRMLQELAMQSRLKIPLMFAQDVIHGFRTTFPIPLAQSCSWDLTLIEQSERIAATEASAYGVHWTFAPMVDLSRDARWGRVMEGSGEDPWLGSQIATARVRGFQGDGIGHTNALMACVKHFAAYGAGVAGRDYDAVDMSNNTLWNFYLPPFKAGIEAGAASVMNAFNDLNGIPATANQYLIRDILRTRWKFTGLVVSDWGSVKGIKIHGYATDDISAAYDAIFAGCDIDMESRCYKNYLSKLVSEKKIHIQLIDEAVARVLTKKFELGLFDDPFKFCNSEREKRNADVPAHQQAARKLARESIVLLKNNNRLLPLNKNQKIAFIGPFAKSVRANLGFWSIWWPDDSSTIVTQFEGISNRLTSKDNLFYSEGCHINDSDTSGFEEAMKIVLRSDVVVLSMGEASDMSGESKSRSNLHLPGVQELLISRIKSSGKPVVLMINAGRPMVIDQPVAISDAVLYIWWLGTQSGNAIADVLFGDYNPSAKLTMSFPRAEGQCPIYYNHLNTGHPPKSEYDHNYVTGYIDIPNSPFFPFGYGLSYTHFQYSDLRLSNDTLLPGRKITASLTVTNTGYYDGEEVVQLYIRDVVASVLRPVKELKGFQKVQIKKGESREIRFELSEEDLKFYNAHQEYVAEPGEFKIFAGTNSSELKEATLILK